MGWTRTQKGRGAKKGRIIIRGGIIIIRGGIIIIRGGIIIIRGGGIIIIRRGSKSKSREIRKILGRRTRGAAVTVIKAGKPKGWKERRAGAGGAKIGGSGGGGEEKGTAAEY